MRVTAFLTGVVSGITASQWPYILVVLVTSAFGMAAVAFSSERYRGEQRIEMLHLANHISDAVAQEIAEKVLISEAVTAAFVADNALHPETFSMLVAQLTREAPDVVNVAAAPDFVVRYVYPFERNRPAIGLNLVENRDFEPGVQRAISTRQTIFDGPFELVQGGTGFITRSAVPHSASDTNDASLWGVVSIVVDDQRLFSEAGLEEYRDAVEILITNEFGEPIFGNELPEDIRPIHEIIETSGVQWSISLVPLNGWAIFSPTTPRIIALTFVIYIFGLLLAFAFNRMLRQMRQAETQLEDAIEALDDAFALYDADDRLVMCNQKYREFYSESAHAIRQGEKFEAVIRAGLAAGQYLEAIGREEDWLRERLEAHANPGSPSEQQMPDGRWLRVVERRTKSGSTVGFRVDITELKEALHQSKAGQRAQSAFLNSISHELRTPLTVILGYNAFIKSSEHLPIFKKLKNDIRNSDLGQNYSSLEEFRLDIARYSMKIETAGEHLLRLISEILDHTSIEQGKINLERENFDLKDLVAEIRDDFGLTVSKKGIDFKVEGESASVFADRMRIRQIIMNLMDNAVKFTDEGEIVIRYGKKGKGGWVSVQDTGPGVPEDRVDAIFDRFVQMDTSEGRKNGGVGLGLTISKELAELHGGKLSAKSVLGEGSVFLLEI